MTNSVCAAIVCGLAAGAFNGYLARWSLTKTLHSRDAVFYSVFAAGIFYRLLFLAGSVWLLRNEKYIIIITFAAALLAAQLGFETVPVKDSSHNGIKRNS